MERITLSNPHVLFAVLHMGTQFPQPVQEPPPTATLSNLEFYADKCRNAPAKLHPLSYLKFPCKRDFLSNSLHYLILTMLCPDTVENRPKLFKELVVSTLCDDVKGGPR